MAINAKRRKQLCSSWPTKFGEVLKVRVWCAHIPKFVLAFYFSICERFSTRGAKFVQGSANDRALVTSCILILSWSRSDTFTKTFEYRNRCVYKNSRFSPKDENRKKTRFTLAAFGMCFFIVRKITHSSLRLFI